MIDFLLKLFSADKKSFHYIFLIIFLPFLTYSQTKSNLDIFNNLVDSSVVKIVNTIPQNSNHILLKLNLGESYTVFSNRIIDDLQSHGKDINLKPDTSGRSIMINYVIDRAKVNYGEMFRKSLFGGYYIPRSIFLSGNFAINSSHTTVKDFGYSVQDTVKVSDVKDLENTSFPFTQGTLPPEPFFSSFYEPVIAIGTAAVAIYLFFKVRSK